MGFTKNKNKMVQVTKRNSSSPEQKYSQINGN